MSRKTKAPAILLVRSLKLTARRARAMTAEKPIGKLSLGDNG